MWYLDVFWHLLNGLDWNLDGLPLVGVLWHLDNALLRALDDLDDIAELLTWLVDVLGDKSWDRALDDFRDFLDLVEWDLNLNDLLDVPDLRELDDLLDLLEDWLLPEAPLAICAISAPSRTFLEVPRNPDVIESWKRSLSIEKYTCPSKDYPI